MIITIYARNKLPPVEFTITDAKHCGEDELKILVNGYWRRLRNSAIHGSRYFIARGGVYVPVSDEKCAMMVKMAGIAKELFNEDLWKSRQDYCINQ